MFLFNAYRFRAFRKSDSDALADFREYGNVLVEVQKAPNDFSVGILNYNSNQDNDWDASSPRHWIDLFSKEDGTFSTLEITNNQPTLLRYLTIEEETAIVDQVKSGQLFFTLTDEYSVNLAKEDRMSHLEAMLHWSINAADRNSLKRAIARVKQLFRI